MKKVYSNAQDFRKALLDRLKQVAIDQNKNAQRLQRQLAVDRLLCRLFSGTKPPWILKGGHALELRIQNSRATKDVDLALKDTKLFNADSNAKQNEIILERLREKANQNLNDYFEYRIGELIFDIEAAPYGGGRFPVEALIDGKLFVKFHLDVGIGDVWIEPHDKIELNDWLSFANISTIKIPLISIEQHFAEKIHAYTIPRVSGFNSRVKDLVDMILLLNEEKLNNSLVKKVIKETFARRGTHTIPEKLIAPPNEWSRPFQTLALECELEMNYLDAFAVIDNFWIKKIIG